MSLSSLRELTVSVISSGVNWISLRVLSSAGIKVAEHAAQTLDEAVSIFAGRGGRSRPRLAGNGFRPIGATGTVNGGFLSTGRPRVFGGADTVGVEEAIAFEPPGLGRGNPSRDRGGYKGRS